LLQRTTDLVERPPGSAFAVMRTPLTDTKDLPRPPVGSPKQVGGITVMESRHHRSETPASLEQFAPGGSKTACKWLGLND